MTSQFDATTCVSTVTNGCVVMMDLIFGLTPQSWGTIVGLIFGAGTFIVNWIYKHQKAKRDEQLTQAKIEQIRQGYKTRKDAQ